MRKHKHEVRMREKKSGNKHSTNVRFQRKQEKQRNPMRKRKREVRMRVKK